MNLFLRNSLIACIILFPLTILSCGGKKKSDKPTDPTDIQQTQEAAAAAVQQAEAEVKQAQAAAQEGAAAVQQAQREVEQIKTENPNPPDPTLLTNLEKAYNAYKQTQAVLQQITSKFVNAREKLQTTQLTLNEQIEALKAAIDEERSLNLKDEENKKLLQEKQQQKDEAQKQLTAAKTDLDTCKGVAQRRSEGYSTDCSRHEQAYQSAQVLLNRAQSQYDEQQNSQQQNYNNLIQTRNKIMELRRNYNQAIIKFNQAQTEYNNFKREELDQARNDFNRAYQAYVKARDAIRPQQSYM